MFDGHQHTDRTLEITPWRALHIFSLPYKGIEEGTLTFQNIIWWDSLQAFAFYLLPQ